VLLLAFSLLAYGTLQFKHISYPLLWQDEAETAMFAERVLEHGYPKVHDGGNVVYGMGIPLSLGEKEATDAYIGSLWGQYYFAAVGAWLARSVEDIYTKTALLRLPFALIGTLGLALCFLAVAPVFSSRRNRLIAAATFALMGCLSTSLILHLREVRYYALVVALVGAALFLHFRSLKLDRPFSLAQMFLQSLTLILLFNVFYPACTALTVWIVLEASLRALRAEGSGVDRLRAAVPMLVPVAVLIPFAFAIAIYFEIPALARFFSLRYAFGPENYLANLQLILHYLLRYEFLAPVLLLEILLLVSHRLRRQEAMPPSPLTQHSAAMALARLCAIYVLIGARNPIFFERYFVPLSPLLSLILLLDADTLAQWLIQVAPLERRREFLLAFAPLVLIGVAGMVWLKRVEVLGRFAEVSTPYRGPLDFMVCYLKEKYGDTSHLRIATNYEGEAYMYYLGSQVVGRFHAQTPEETAKEYAIQVDVVIPRKAQPKRLDWLLPYLAKGEFSRHDLPVIDLPYNNIPELFSGRVLTTTHLFRTASPDGESELLSIYERVK